MVMVIITRIAVIITLPKTDTRILVSDKTYKPHWAFYFPRTADILNV